MKRFMTDFEEGKHVVPGGDLPHHMRGVAELVAGQLLQRAAHVPRPAAPRLHALQHQQHSTL